MNCVSIAILPLQAAATIRRVIEYFCPNDRQGSRIWVDLFIENSSPADVTLQVLHAGSFSAQDVSEVSWGRAAVTTDCESVLTARIKTLHKDEDYFPIKLSEKCVELGKDRYHLWNGKLGKLIGGNPAVDVPFTLWQLDSVRPGKTILRLCLEMHGPTREKRLGNNSFFAYGEAIVLRNIEDGILPCYGGADAEEYRAVFAEFKRAHKAPEAFEYLIVCPEKEKLLWDAVPLSPSLSPQYIYSNELARTTRWFTADGSDSWELQASVLEIAKTREMHFAVASQGD